MTTDRRSFDVIVVGAGSSGCALAARLSEDPGRHVALVEAGPYFPSLDAFPPELAFARSFAATVPGHPLNWAFVGEAMPGRRFPMPRGRVFGGSSALNGTYFIRARRSDFTAWARAGGPIWDFDAVLPFYRRSEADHDFAGPLHGTSGPMPVARVPDADLRPISRAFELACRAEGFPAEADKNGELEPGVGRIPRNCLDGKRINTAVAYLGPAAGRPNLHLIAGLFVDRVLFAGQRAIGITGRRGWRRVSLAGGEVVLCAGGIKTPHLLLLSGIGPAGQLTDHGVPVVADLPGVGQGISDHAMVSVNFGAGPVADDGSSALPLQLCLNHLNPATGGALQISCASVPLGTLTTPPGTRLPSYWRHPLATLAALRGLSPAALVRQATIVSRDLLLMCSLDTPRSRGEIRLVSGRARAQPRIRLNYLSHPDDRADMRHNVRTAARLLATEPMRAAGVHRTNLPAAIVEDDAALDRWIEANLASSFHTACGARMGPDDDTEAVVDGHCRVRGVAGLRVADISILPRLISRGPNATAVMIGERVADLLDKGGA